MKKKEVLIVSGLAVLVAVALACLVPRGYWVDCGEGFRPRKVYFRRMGWPLIFFSCPPWCIPENLIIAPPHPFPLDAFDFKTFWINLLLWFLVIFAIWQVMEWIRRRRRR